MNDPNRTIELQPELVREIWRVIKDLRDEIACLRAKEQRLNELLKRMKEAGMADWLPSIEEVIASGPYTLTQRD